MDLPHWSAADGADIQRNGARAIKKPNPVWLWQQTSDFTVETNEGTVAGKAGDFLAYDPISRHVCPVASSYVAQHYDLTPAP